MGSDFYMNPPGPVMEQCELCGERFETLDSRRLCINCANGYHCQKHRCPGCVICCPDEEEPR